MTRKQKYVQQRAEEWRRAQKAYEAAPHGLKLARLAKLRAAATRALQAEVQR